MLEKRDVIEAYRVLLNREPESEDVVREKMASCPTRKQLVRRLLDSTEFKKNIGFRRYFFDCRLPPLDVDVDIDKDAYERLLAKTQAAWKALGDSEPYWSVFTNEKFKKASIDEHKSDFYGSGRDILAQLLASLRRAGVISRDSEVRAMDILEIGCGVGRVTSFLAKCFRSVEAVDISRPHLALAEEYVADANVRFRQITTLDDYGNLSACDIAFSVIVLQHSPPPIMAHVLSCMFKALRPGGVAYFQLPTYADNYRFRLAEYLEQEGGGMEMHCLPQRYVYEIADRHDCLPLEVSEDAMTGGISLSNTFIFRKKASLR